MVYYIRNNTSMKPIVSIFISILCLIACKKPQINSTQSIEAKSITTIEERIVDILIASRDGKTIEFPDLYEGVVNSISNDSEESLKLVSLLKSRGFEITNWGRGNYPPRGPRIVMRQLRKDNCECEVNKIYYSTISKGIYEIAERIKCKSI